MLIQTVYGEDKLFVEIFEPYKYEDFVIAATKEFSIKTYNEEITLFLNGSVVRDSIFKNIVQQFYNIPSFQIEIQTKVLEFDASQSSDNSKTSSSELLFTENTPCSTESQSAAVTSEQQNIDTDKSNFTSNLQFAATRTPGTSESMTDSCVIESIVVRKPSIPDVKAIRELPIVAKILKDFLSGKALQNKERVKIAKCIIDECLKNKPDKILNRSDFENLSDSIVTIFATEVESAYYLPSMKSCPARGKLWSAYNNKRTFLSIHGQIIRRTKTSTIRKGSPIPKTEFLLESIQFLEENTSDWPMISLKWSETHTYRMRELQSSISTHDYIKKYPALHGCKGVDLITIDVNILYPSLSTVNNWIKLYPNVVNEARLLRDKVVRRKIAEIDSSEEERYKAQLSLMLIPYLLSHSGKRRENGEGNATKNEIQERFIKEYKNLTHLNEDPEASDLQIKCVNNNGVIPYAEFVIAGYVFKCCDLLEALHIAFMYMMGINVSYPKLCTHVWQFIQLSIYKIPLTDIKVPNIETIINDIFDMN